MQALANTLNTPLEVHDARENWTRHDRSDHAETEGADEDVLEDLEDDRDAAHET